MYLRCIKRKGLFTFKFPGNGLNNMAKKRISQKIEKEEDSPSTKKMKKVVKEDVSDDLTPRELKFEDYPEFKPNLTPRQMFLLGAFGGNYWRDIKSGLRCRMVLFAALIMFF